MDEIYLNGKFIKKSDAQISIMDRGFLFGDGVYELIPVYNHKIFLLNFSTILWQLQPFKHPKIIIIVGFFPAGLCQQTINT